MKEIEMTSENRVFKTNEDKEWLRVLLHEREVSVSFTKKDGTERKMICTLSENKIPAGLAPKGTKKTEKTEIGEALAVFDLEKSQWRSFRFDSIKEIRFDL
jgi:hypothetical protein